MGALRLVRAAQLAFREHPARRAAPVDYKAASCGQLPLPSRGERAISVLSRKRDDGLHAMIENTPPRFLNSRPHVGGHSC